MNKNDILALLEKMDLSHYEARAFLAAMGQPPMTGYKLSQLSGVPRSRIYETIEKLAGKGLLVFQSGEKNLLAPLNFNAFLDRKEKENNERIQHLRKNLPQMQPHENEGIWNISGRAKTLETAQDLIMNAQKYIYAEFFSDDLADLEPVLLNRQKKGIAIWGIYCGKSGNRIVNFFPHLGNNCSTCNEIAICVDGRQALIGCTKPADTSRTALTQNRGFIKITEQYIKHEVFLHKMIAGSNQKEIKFYLNKYKSIMDQLP